MTKYIVEGGINFFEELSKSLNMEDDEIADQDLCLISNTPLTDGYITLDCSHKFNYAPLYNDIMNHKNKYNVMERRHLNMHEIRCPYCRHIQKKLLPECDGFENVHGVNCINEEVLLTGSDKYLLLNGYKIGTCCHEIHIEYEVIKCNHNYVKLLEEDGKTYCHYHKYFAMKNALKAKKIKAKEDAKLAKELEKQKIKAEKEAAKKEKELAKQQAKESKINSKSKATKVDPSTNANANANANAIVDENYIITSEDVLPSDDICKQILISGKNKGKSCCKKIHKDELCMRHYNILQYKLDVSNIQYGENTPEV